MSDLASSALQSIVDNGVELTFQAISEHEDGKGKIWWATRNWGTPWVFDAILDKHLVFDKDKDEIKLVKDDTFSITFDGPPSDNVFLLSENKLSPDECEVGVDWKSQWF